MAVGPPPESEENIVSEEQLSEDGKKARKKSKAQNYNCLVTCLNGSTVKAEIERTAKGDELFNQVVTDLKITEKEYVGLHFTNEKGVKMWLDIHKDMKHQIGDNLDPEFQFRLKFYEPEPGRIKDVFMRYLLYLQLREEITGGKLECAENIYAILGSYTVQAELGDFNLHTHEHDYLNGYEFCPEQNANMIDNIRNLHKELRGQSQSTAELNFLEIAKTIPRYGVDVHKAKDNGTDVEIGVAAIGVYVYRYSRKEYLFRWQIVDTILYNRRKYTVKLKEDVPKTGEDEEEIKGKKKPQLTHIYYFESATKCKQCYKSSVEYHTFFRLAKPDPPRKKGNSLKIGSSFRYSDNTLYQIRQRSNNDDDDPGTEVSFTRTPSKRRGSNTPRGSWNPHDENLKNGPNDDSIINGTRPVEPIQYEEIEIDEANPDDDKFDPEEWEVIEKILPDGTTKRYRRRVIKKPPRRSQLGSCGDSPVKTLNLMNEPYFITLDNTETGISEPVDETIDFIPIQVEETQIVMEEPTSELFDEPPVSMRLEEIEIDEENPEDSWYDPSEWDVVERTLPDGTKKRFRVRMVEETVVPDDSSVFIEEEPMEMEEIEIDETDPEDSKYDPKDWDIVERTEPDGTKKRFRRRYIITKIATVPKKEVSSLLEEPPMHVEEVDVDEANPDDDKYDPTEWEVAEKLSPDGEVKRVRRRIVITRVVIVPKKLCDISPEEPLAQVEEVDIDEAHPEDDKYDPNEWEVAEKVLPDGTKKPVRRRILITRVQVVHKKPCDVTPDEPLAVLEEVDFDEFLLSHVDDEKYNPDEWEVAEKILPDGTKKPVRRRVIVTRVQFIKKKPSELSPCEPLAKIEEVEIDETNPEDDKYDPAEWEVAEKVLPDGTKKPVRRRVIITRLQIVHKKPCDISPDEPVAVLEEVEVDQAHEDEYNPDEWEVAEKVLPDGTKIPVRRRIVITRVQVVNKKPCELPVDEPLMEIEEVEVDEANPDDDKYDPTEWEVAEKIMPDGTKKPIRQRCILRTVKVEHVKPCDVPADMPVAEVEEIEMDEVLPIDDSFDPNDWEFMEKILPDGTKKHVHCRYIIKQPKTVYKKPSDVLPDDPEGEIEEVEINEENKDDDKYDPSEWEVAEKTLPDGTTLPVRRRYVNEDVEIVHKKPCDISPLEPVAVIEEVVLDEAHPEDDEYDPTEWEVSEKTLPDGTKIPVRRRCNIKQLEVVHKKPCDVSSDIPLVKVEEVELDEAHPENDQYDPAEWEVGEKIMPDGTKIPVRRRYVIRRVVTVHKKPCDVSVDEPIAQVEEVEVDEANPDDDKYDPTEWEVAEKILPDGTKKPVHRRYVIKKIVTVYKKPCDISSEEPMAQLEEVEFDEAHPEEYDPDEWEVAELTTPDGEKKTILRRCIIKEVHTDYIKPCELSADEPLAVIEEVEFDEASPENIEYDPTEWETAEKVLPDGTKKPVRRRYIITSRKVVYKKPCDMPVDEPITQVEEVEIDEAHPEDNKYDPSEWEVCEKTLPDGTKKPIRRRYIITSRKVVYKTPTEVACEKPCVEIEEVEIKEDKFDDPSMTFDPTEWDVIERVDPDGKKKHYRCRVVVKEPKTEYKKPSEISADDEPYAKVEEVEMDEAHPVQYNPAEWDVVNTVSPDGTKKVVRRRYVITRVHVIHKKPSELSPDEDEGVAVEEVEVNDEKPDDDYDPADWYVLEKTLPDGTKKKVRRRIILKTVETAHKYPEVPIIVDEIAIMPTAATVEEFVPAGMLLPIDGETSIDKHGRKKVIRRRSIKTTITPVGGRSVSVSTEEVPKHGEEVEIDEAHPEDDKYDPQEWEIVEKKSPNGTTKRFRRRVVNTVITTVQKKYSDVMVDGSPIRMEEFEIDDTHPENEQFDPTECEILEKTLPDGTKKKFSRRIISSTLPDIDKSNETPSLWEEVEINENDPEDKKFDPEEWEVLTKILPDGTKKRFRRRNLNVITVHKKPIAITAGDSPLRVQEVEIDEVMNENLDLGDWEVIEKTLPDGTKKKIHRRILTTIFSSLNQKNEMIENPPIHIEEVEIYEASDEDDEKYDPMEWLIATKEAPDGKITTIRSRSSVTIITPKDTMTLEDKRIEEIPITADVIELDESHPGQSFNPEEWDIVEKKLPDGTTKRFHRRIIRIIKKHSHEEPANDDIPDGQVEETPIEIEEIAIDETNPEDEKSYNPEEWELVEREMPDGTVKRFRRKIITTMITTVTTKTIIVHPDGTEEVVDVVEESTPSEIKLQDLESCTENFLNNLKPEEEPVIQPLLEENLQCGIDADLDNLLSEIDENLKSLSDDEARISESDQIQANRAQKQIEEEKLKKLEETLTEEENKFKEFEEAKLEKLREGDLKRMKEEERKRLDDHNATMSSIFTLPDDEEYASRGDSLFDSVSGTTFEDDDDDFEFGCADEVAIPEEGEIIRTASVLAQKKIPRSQRHSSAEDDSKKILSLDRRYLKRGGTLPDMDPPRSHSAVPHNGSPDHPRVPIRSVSSAGMEQSDAYLHHEDGPHSEIVYTLQDVAEVEQGVGGFVQSIRERHEEIATRELNDIRRNSTYLDDTLCHGHNHGHGHVPTHTVNYSNVKEPETSITKDPPAVTGKPILIIPASSELPDEEVVFEASQSPEEAHPDLPSDDLDSVKIPEVETHSVVFEEKPEDDVIYVRDPGVETRTVQIVPVTESYTMQHETIHDLRNASGIISTSGNCQVTTHTLPTEIITKTITVEGDSSTMTAEELQEIIRKSGSDENILDDTLYSSTHVVSTTTVQKVITGQSITVSGNNAEDFQKAIDEAVKEATSVEHLDDDEGSTIVITAVEQYDEDGKVVSETYGDVEGDMGTEI